VTRATETDFREVPQRLSLLPDITHTRRQQGARKLREFTNELLRAIAKRELDSARGSEEICYERKRRALYIGEQKRGAATLYDAAVNFSDL
jgi:hypothetical protein